MRKGRGFTLLELLASTVILGIIATTTFIYYAGVRQKALDRDAMAYLQILRQAALYYYNEFNEYPTNIGQVPQVKAPRQGNPASAWAYCFAGNGGQAWSRPGAVLKPSVRSIEIRQNGNFINPASLNSSNLSDEP